MCCTQFGALNTILCAKHRLVCYTQFGARLVFGTSRTVPGVCYTQLNLCLVFAACCVFVGERRGLLTVPGVWCAYYSAWCLVFGTRRTVFGVWCSSHCAWCLVHAALCLVFGAENKSAISLRLAAVIPACLLLFNMMMMMMMLIQFHDSFLFMVNKEKNYKTGLIILW